MIFTCAFLPVDGHVFFVKFAGDCQLKNLNFNYMLLYSKETISSFENADALYFSSPPHFPPHISKKNETLFSLRC
jgi:hypothetical protein